MRTSFKWLVGSLAALILIGLGGIALERHLRVARILADYTDHAVLTTFAAVTADTQALHAAALRLQNAPSDAALAAAADAWRAARARWKLSSAYLYGPAAFYNLDKQIASWPLDRPRVDHLLTQIAAGRLDLNAGYLREHQDATLRGFHAAEYLLFRDGRPRRAADLSPAQLRYLVAVTQAMGEDCIALEAWWLGQDRLPAAAAGVLAAAGIQTRGAYADELRHAGTAGSRYASESVAVQEIFQESVRVAEALCVSLGETLGSSDPRDSETWYSWNALADFGNQVQSIENAYLGGAPGARGRSPSDLVAARHPVLDRRVQIGLADLRRRIAGVGDLYPIQQADRGLKTRIAAASCLKLEARLEAALGLLFPAVDATTLDRPPLLGSR